MNSERITHHFFLLVDFLFLVAVAYASFAFYRRRTLPKFPPPFAVAAGILYLLLYAPFWWSSELRLDYVLHLSHPYSVFMFALHWPVIHFIAWAAYPPGGGYIDVPLLEPSLLWIGGLGFYFLAGMVVLYIARGVDSIVKALTIRFSQPRPAGAARGG